MTTLTFLGKLLRAVITLWLTVSLAFILMRMAGDPAEALVPPDAGPELLNTTGPNGASINP